LRVALIQNSDFGLWHFHRSLVTSLRSAGAEVWTITPAGPFIEKIEALGAHHISVPMARYVDPRADAVLFIRLVRIFREVRPDVVHTITIKPNTIGVFAASFAGVPRIVSQVPGLGYAFDARGLRSRIIPEIVKFLYRLAFRRVARAWFLNPDDYEEFVKEKLIDPAKGVVIRSCGVNLSDYAPAEPGSPDPGQLRRELGIPDEWRVVLMAGRMIWSKGVREFAEAAGVMGRRGEPVIFLLAGSLEFECPDPVPEEYLKSHESPHFRWLGFRPDISRLLQLADIVVLPSFYREGVPRILLEALATGKPIITTETPGCREVVEPGRNGFFVPARDVPALVKALEVLLGDAGLLAAFGEYSRRKAEMFGDDKVMEAVLRDLYPALRP
jgi:N,N'-diacetylbacillosaminyl-diphospho-undecaprenol alpha-1,3-N-acetylgalactosaminyltransferase